MNLGIPIDSDEGEQDDANKLETQFLKSKTIENFNKRKKLTKSPLTSKNRYKVQVLQFPSSREDEPKLKTSRNERENEKMRDEKKQNNLQMLKHDSLEHFPDDDKSFLDITQNDFPTNQIDVSMNGIVKKTRDYLYNLPLNLVPLEQDYNQFYRPINTPVYDETVFEFKRSQYLRNLVYFIVF